MLNLRSGLRALLRAPSFTLLAAAVLALGMGSATAVFTLIRALLLQPLPYPESGRLAWVSSVPPRSGAGLQSLSIPDFLELRSQTRLFEDLGGLFPGSWNVTGAGEPQRLSGARVTTGFFETLRMTPQIGRVFLAEEYHTGREMAVIFSHSFWQSHFGGDPNVVGRRITMDGVPFEVVGIMPPEFALAAEYDLWAPFPQESQFATNRRMRWLRSFGRLKPGVSLEQAQGEATALATGLSTRYPEDRDYGLRLVTFLDQEIGSVRRTLWVFAAAVGCLLLIACSNVASLLIARGASRVREMAVRAALGAGRRRLVLESLTESALLAIAGGMLGYPLAVWGVRLLLALDPQALPRAQEIHADARVMLFAFGLALVTGLIAGIVPALRGSRTDLREALAEGGRGSAGGRLGNRLRSALVVIEVALGVVLMTSAGLLAHSFRRLTEVRPGYDIDNVLAMQIALTDVRYKDSSKCVAFYERLLSEIERIPGVRAAGSTNYLPLRKDKNNTSVWLDTQPVRSEETKVVLENRVVTADYFRAMGVPLVAGRFFNWSDRAGTPKVMIVNDTFAREFFPRGDAIGHRVTVDAGVLLTFEIVGITGSFRDANLAEEPRREIFTSYAQTTIPGQTLVVRSTGDAAAMTSAIRSAVASIDPDVPVYNVRTMKQQAADSVAQPRLRSVLLDVFSIMALVLSALGVYGVIACAVAERRREIGIRVALGAGFHEVRRMVVGQGLKLTGLGLALGLAGSVAAARLLQGFLFGVGPGDPAAFVGTGTVFIVVALVASYLPARRATRVDPTAVLREE